MAGSARISRGVAAAVAAAALLCLRAAAADAATVGYVWLDGEAEPPTSLTYTAGEGELADLEVTRDATGALVFHDRSGAVPIDAGAGCQASEPTVRCALPVDEVHLQLGEGADYVRIDAGEEPLVSVAAGHGADLIHDHEGGNRLSGGEGDDLVIGGAGADRLDGGEGADAIWARDEESDTVACGEGDPDEVLADATDAVSADCESVQLPAPAPAPLPAPVPEAAPVLVAPPPVPPARPPRGVRLPARKAITLAISHKRIRPRQRVHVFGIAPPLTPVRLDADFRLRARYVEIARTTSDAEGVFLFRALRPSRSTRYLARVGGQVSPTVQVKVRKKRGKKGKRRGRSR